MTEAELLDMEKRFEYLFSIFQSAGYDSSCWQLRRDLESLIKIARNAGVIELVTK